MQRQGQPKPRRNRFQLTLDQQIEKWEDDGFRSKPVTTFCYKMAVSTTVRERDRLQQEFRQCCMVSLKSYKDNQKLVQMIDSMLQVDAFPILPIRGTHQEEVTVKLLPLPQPPVRARTDARTNPSAQRATQLMSVLARVYAVSIQNQITTTVP
jgi:hypothetical protein